MQWSEQERTVRVPAGPVTLEGDLTVPDGAQGQVLFAHGSGSSRHSPRNRRVARLLNEAGLATLLLDLLTADEEIADRSTGHLRFDIGLLAERLVDAADWLGRQPGDARPCPRLLRSEHRRRGLTGGGGGSSAYRVRRGLPRWAARPRRPVAAGGPRTDTSDRRRRRHSGDRAQPSGLRATPQRETAGHHPRCHSPVRGAGRVGSGGPARPGVVRAAPRPPGHRGTTAPLTVRSRRRSAPISGDPDQRKLVRIRSPMWGSSGLLALGAAAGALAATAFRPAAASSAAHCAVGDTTLVRDILYFGRNTPGGMELSDSAWQQYVDEVLTPRFPAGLTIWDAAGQWRGASGKVERERSKVLTLLHSGDDALGFPRGRSGRRIQAPVRPGGGAAGAGDDLLPVLGHDQVALVVPGGDVEAVGPGMGVHLGPAARPPPGSRSPARPRSPRRGR